MLWWLACARGPAPADACADVGWEGSAAPTLTTWCTPCHASAVVGEERRGAPVGVDFDTWESARAWADRIAVRAGPGGSMPPAGGIGEAEREDLARWAACGAPGTPSAPDPCAPRVDFVGSATAAGEPCAAGANAVTGDLVVATDPGTALDCVCAVDGALALDAPARLPNLREAGAVSISAAGAVELPALARAGEVVVQGAALDALALDSLTTVDGSFVAVDASLPPAFAPPRLAVVGENLLLRGVGGVRRADLVRLEQVGLDLAVEELPDLVELPSPRDLESVGRDLRVLDNPQLAELTGFESLSDVGGDLEIGGGGALAALSGFYDLDEVGGDLILRDEGALGALDGFPELTRIGGELRLLGLGAADAAGFERLDEVGGIVVAQAPRLAGWSGGAVAHVLGDVVVDGDPALRTVPLVSPDTRIDGSLVVRGLPSLVDLGGIDPTGIDGDLVAQDTALLATLGLADLVDIAGDLVVERNVGLVDLGLPALRAVGGDVVVLDNPALSGPAVEAWLSGVAVGGEVSVGGNGP